MQTITTFVLNVTFEFGDEAEMNQVYTYLQNQFTAQKGALASLQGASATRSQRTQVVPTTENW